MRIDSNTGLFRRPVTGQGVPTHTSQNTSARPARDPTLAPEPVAANRISKAYAVHSKQQTASYTTGPALVVSLSPEAQTWLAERGLAGAVDAPNTGFVPPASATAESPGQPPDLGVDVPVPQRVRASLNLAV